MSETSFTCKECGQSFTLRQDVLDRYPGWRPALCMPCKNGARRSGKKGQQNLPQTPARKSRSRSSGKSGELDLTLEKVLARFDQGPFDGVFTDGACSGNPGPGGWGAVWVEGDRVVEQRHGHAERTTNNRMELTALIEAYRMLPADAELTIWSDSNLCVQTINEWAAGWKRLGWRRKKGPVLNLDLVQPAYELALAHPKVRLRWIKAHNGSRWNEYADSLATAFQRSEL